MIEAAAPALLIAAYVLAINLAGFLAFAWDKHCARNRMWRISEATLLMMAALGGSAGTVIGQRIFRHKTRKQPFRTQLRWVIIIQVVVLVAFAFPQVRGAIRSAVDRGMERN